MPADDVWPVVSVVTPVHSCTVRQLRATLRSVREQTFGGWEHVLVASRRLARSVDRALARAAARDRRVRVVPADEVATIPLGGLVALLGAGDVLTTDALDVMVTPFDDGAVDVAYSDQDFVASDGYLVDACYKPDFSPERLRGQNYVGNMLVARRAVVEQAGGIGDRPAGARDHGLVLRLTERARRVAHVPRIVYHERHPTPPVATADIPSDVAAVAAHCARVGIDASVVATANDGCYRVVRRLHHRPLVSVVVPTRGTSGRVWGVERCFVVEALRSVAERSTYEDLEFVVVHDADTPPDAITAIERIGDVPITLVAFDEPFNFSTKVNRGVERAAGSAILLLNDDTELIEPTSIDVLVGHLEMPDVAMVGARLLFADGTLQHGGHVYARRPEHACMGWRGDSPGPRPLRPLAIERECSGVTAACALVRRSAFDAVGGLPDELPLNYNDVDLSLKLRAAGHRIVWTPWALWYHFESRTRARGVHREERTWIEARWRAELIHDPYFNPNLAPCRDDFLEAPPRSEDVRWADGC
jgi:GT2 family glycosyltransferase